jgi:hypothetical protein
MGKRELLLVSAFAVVGLLVYQLTMPATADSGGGFGAWWARVKSHMRQNWAEQRFERRQDQPVPPGVTTLALELDRAAVTITGEARDTIGVELTGVVYGGDAQQARAMADLVAMTATTEGPVQRFKVTLPTRDELSRRPNLRVVLKVPARLGLEVRTNGGGLDVSGIASVHAAKAGGRVRFASIAGAITGEVGRGELDIDRAGSVKIETEYNQVHISHVTGTLHVSAERVDLQARDIGGAVTFETRDGSAEFEDLAGPLSITGRGGEVRVRGKHGPIEAKTDRTTLNFVPREAVPITATVERDDIDLTLPPGGVFLDATVTDGDVRVPEGLITVTRTGEQVSANGPVRGGGPRVVLKVTRGNVTIR